MSEVWIRKDFLMVGFFILILMVYIQKRLPFWLKILLINLLSIFIILTHEVFAFFALPVLFLLLFNFFHEKRKIYASIGFSLAVLFPSILTFLLVTVNHGDQTTVQAIWDSWSAISGKEIIRIPGNNAVDAIGWPGIDTLFFHFRINFLLEEFYILSIWYWLIVFPVVYYISTNAFSVFKKRPEVYTENDRTILSSILCFQLLCLSPLFVCLSIDYIRLFFYLTASSFALFLMVPQNVLANLFPVLPVQLIKKINKGFDLVLPPSKTTLAFLMLIVGISYSGFTLKTIWMSTMVYRIFLLFSEPVILFRDFFLN
ncbi:MAG: hypothetical protein LBT25_12560 [Candidatus Symbiothrix sp.]|nr:hypothetical protein [Candidatus Symbiothrix sp.]